MADFDAPFRRTLGFEGIALSEDPDDPGGLTFCGIARAYNPSWSGWPAIDKLLSVYSTHEAGVHAAQDPVLMGLVKDFYKLYEWDNNYLGDLEYQELATQLYDAIVNMGHHPIEQIQRLVTADVDGIMGPRTVSLINSNPFPSKLVDLLLLWREAYYRKRADERPQDAKDLDGWLSRCVRTDKVDKP